MVVVVSRRNDAEGSLCRTGAKNREGGYRTMSVSLTGMGRGVLNS